MTERRYQMTRIGAGDYLLPSNDGQTIWRLIRYQEDGSATWGDTNKPVLGWFWGLWRYTGRMNGSLDPKNWNTWEITDSGFWNRKQAIEAALQPREGRKKRARARPRPR